MFKVRPAAGIIALRQHQVYLVQRGCHSRFLPGFHAFPGGTLDAQDPDLKHCAARELWEETGLWVGPIQPSTALRQEWLSGNLAWNEVIEQYPLQLEQLIPAGVRTAPAYTPVRFCAHFFLWNCPPHQRDEVWPGELQNGQWWDLDEALNAWGKAQIFLAPPTQDSLITLSKVSTLQERSQKLCQIPEHSSDPIKILPGLNCIALKTATLPPAQHTLCYLLGQEHVMLVDPGAPDISRIEALQLPVSCVILTHHHQDHVGGVARCQQLGWPIWAHHCTGKLLQVHLDRLLQDQDVLGEWQILHTPGHASGHLALWREQGRILICGDLASTISSIIVPTPDGNMAQYLESLSRCHQLNPQLILPSHGGPCGPGSDLLHKTMEHRLKREALIISALGGSFEQVLAKAYADVAAPLLDLARVSLVAHLEKLQHEGRAQKAGECWRPA